MVVLMFCVNCHSWKNHSVYADSDDGLVTIDTPAAIACDGCGWERKAGYRQRAYIVDEQARQLRQGILKA